MVVSRRTDRQTETLLRVTHVTSPSPAVVKGARASGAWDFYRNAGRRGHAGTKWAGDMLPPAGVVVKEPSHIKEKEASVLFKPLVLGFLC